MAPRNGLPAMPRHHRTLEVLNGAVSAFISASRLWILISNARCVEPITFFSYALFLVSLITSIPQLLLVSLELHLFDDLQRSGPLAYLLKDVCAHSRQRDVESTNPFLRQKPTYFLQVFPVTSLIFKVGEVYAQTAIGLQLYEGWCDHAVSHLDSSERCMTFRVSE